MFTIRGLIDGCEGEVEITWCPFGPARKRAKANGRGLVGDEDVIRRAMVDEVDGRTFRATPTGPFFRADLDNAEAALTQLTSYVLPRYRLEGKPPTIGVSVPEGAIP